MGSEFQFQERLEFSLFNSVQTGSGAHVASHLMDIGGSFSGDKAAGA
jgi:hypothetical protein